MTAARRPDIGPDRDPGGRGSWATVEPATWPDSPPGNLT